MECLHKKRDGQQCGRASKGDGGYCGYHEPDKLALRIEQLAQARKMGKKKDGVIERLKKDKKDRDMEIEEMNKEMKKMKNKIASLTTKMNNMMIYTTVQDERMEILERRMHEVTTVRVPRRTRRSRRELRETQESDTDVENNNVYIEYIEYL